MASDSSFYKIPFGAAKLCQDIATLINNRQGSDVQFIVGGGISSIQGNGDTIYDKPATVTLYAHSLILRCRSPYFAAMLDEERNWKENLKGVIYKPNVSPSTFQDVLHYIYTGDVRAKTSENIMELIAAADEMGLEELNVECQAEFIRTVKCIFSDEDKESTKQHIPVDIAIRTHIIPALNLASSHSLSNLSHELLTIMLPRISVIIKAPDVYTTFINGISSEALVKIIGSDDLAMTEGCIWDLALSWACHRTKLSKTDIEARLNNLDEEEEESSDEVVNDTQLKQLKEMLTPLLPAIRFSLLYSKDYRHLVNILNYFLPRRRYLKINQFFLSPNGKELLDPPRKNTLEQKILSKIVIESTTLEFLGRNIFGAGGITGCRSIYDLEFELLFRASEHDFLASAFHQLCDNKGPTIVIVRSTDGHLFGGVNFNDWKSDGSWSVSIFNFLFALPDGHHRKDPTIFGIEDQINAKKSSCNYHCWGPYFGGGSDLAIADSANTGLKSYSNLPYSYNGSGASNTALAGVRNFTVSDYEVFAISNFVIQ